jgi:hypothetical protein
LTGMRGEAQAPVLKDTAPHIIYAGDKPTRQF